MTAPAGVGRSRRTLGGAVIALALVPAGLTACSSRPHRPFTPADLPADPSVSAPRAVPEPTPAGTTAAPDPTTVPGTVTEETVRVAPDVQVVIERPVGVGSDADDVIDAFRDHFTGLLRAVVTGGRDTSYLEAVQDTALQDSYQRVHRLLDARMSLRGTARLYAVRVPSVTGRGAQLNVCMDESEIRLIDSGTGKAVREQPDWTREPFFQVAGVRRGDDGVWRVKFLQHAKLPSEPAKGCLR